MAFPIVEKAQQSGLRQGKLPLGHTWRVNRTKWDQVVGLPLTMTLGKGGQVIVIWESFGDPFSAVPLHTLRIFFTLCFLCSLFCSTDFGCKQHLQGVLRRSWGLQL